MLWLDAHASQRSNLKLLVIKTYNNSMNSQLNWLELVLHGEQNLGYSTGEICWKYVCILALALFYESKWTRTKFMIEITPSL